MAPGSRVALLTSADQILSSLSNALLLFTVAQTASVAQFGSFALLVAVAAVWTAFNRGALGVPMLLASNLAPQEIRMEAGYTTMWAALSGVGAAASVCVVGVMTADLSTAVVFAVVVPAVMVQDILRFAAISGGRPFVAVLSDGLWTLSIASAFLANILGAAVSVSFAVALWGASGLLAALLLALVLGVGPKIYRIPGWWRTYAGARVHFGLGDALAPIYTAVVLFAVTLIADSSVAGALRGATTLFGPIALLFSALPLIFVPHARRSVAPPREQWRLLARVSWISSALTAAATAAFVVLPHGLGVAILGQTWDSAVAVIPYEGLLTVAAIWITSIYILFQTLGRSRAAFWTRMLQLVAQLTGAITAAVVVGTATAVAGTTAGFCWLAVIVGVIVARRIVGSSDEDLLPQGVSDLRAETAPCAGGRAPSQRRPWPVIDVLEGEVSRSR